MRKQDTPTTEVIEEARAWALDCAWEDYDLIEDMTPDQIMRGVEKHFVGGWNAFVETCQPIEVNS